MSVDLPKCHECARYLVSLGFKWYAHPPLLDYVGRIMADPYQCSLVGKSYKFE